MRILGIETSCDETAAAVVEDGRKVLANVVASSSDMHAKTGGIIPENAARAQLQSIIPVIGQALSDAFSYGKRKAENEKAFERIDAIAVTYGPGLIGSLLVGVETAKTLAYLWKKPIVPVNHLVGHIYANWLIENSKPNTPYTKHKTPRFPALVLVVSGGHTDLVLMESHGKIKWIGGTRDDAAGEAFDKTARLLGLPYPGGPAIAAAAEKHFNGKRKTKSGKRNLFPRPMIKEDNFDWSFSGLKTAVLKEVNISDFDKNKIPRFSREIQEAIADVLTTKTIKAVIQYKPKSLLLAGGVAANNRLREKLKKQINQLTNQPINLFVPPPFLCIDNATFIASCAYYNYEPLNWRNISANPQLSIVGEK